MGLVKIITIFFLFASVLDMIAGCSEKEEGPIPKAEKSIDSALMGQNERWTADLDEISKV